LVAEAVGRIGADGIISVREEMGLESSARDHRRAPVSGGYLSPYFVNQPEEMRVELRDCWVLVHDQPMTSLSISCRRWSSRRPSSGRCCW